MNRAADCGMADATRLASTREAARQQALLDAIAGTVSAFGDLGFVECGERAGHGIAAYRTNAARVAERALEGAFPTVRQLVGAADFARLAGAFRCAHPPLRGDLGEWGGAFPDWLEVHPALAEWRYLGDCGRLDLALHRCERAADATFDAASLMRLEQEDPARLLLRLKPGTAVLASAWPIVTIRAAHRATEPDLEPARQAVTQRQAEIALIVRDGWRAAVHPIDGVTLGWTRDLLGGVNLARALERAGDRFDFSGWLARALRAGWLEGAVCID